MRAARSAGAFLAASALLAQPCLAAEDFRDPGPVRPQASAFAGASLRVPLGAARRAVPTARLQLGLRHGGMPRPDPRPAAFELGLRARGAPAFYLGGRDVAETRRRLGIKGSPGWVVPALIIGAVVVGVVLLTDPSSDATPAAPAT